MLWIKIAISLLAVGITLIEVWEFRRRSKNRKWNKLKRPLIIVSSLILLLLTVWDEIADENEYQEEKTKRTEQTILEETRRNKQIIKDSIRASQIITGLGNAITKIDSSTQNLVKVDSSIGVVKNVLDRQIGSLTSIVSESKETQNNLTGGDSYLKYFLIKRWRSQVLELHCAVMGKYPMRNVNSYITCRSFQDSLLRNPITLEPLINGNGMNMAFEVNFSSLTSNNPTFLIAKFNTNDFKGDMKLGFWTYSNNGSTFQLITWKNHKKYFSSPPKTNNITVKSSDNTDWSGDSFEYSTYISRATPIDLDRMGENFDLDNTAGIYYYESHTVMFNLFNTIQVN